VFPAASIDTVLPPCVAERFEPPPYGSVFVAGTLATVTFGLAAASA
jgi:hypothetical protein